MDDIHKKCERPWVVNSQTLLTMKVRVLEATGAGASTTSTPQGAALTGAGRVKLATKSVWLAFFQYIVICNDASSFVFVIFPFSSV